MAGQSVDGSTSSASSTQDLPEQFSRNLESRARDIADALWDPDVFEFPKPQNRQASEHVAVTDGTSVGTPDSSEVPTIPGLPVPASDSDDIYGFWEREACRASADKDHEYQRLKLQRGPSPPKLSREEREALRSYPPFRWIPNMRMPSPGMDTPIRQLIEHCFPRTGIFARLQYRYPHADFGKLRELSWLEVCEHETELARKATIAGAQRLNFKFGITCCLIHRWETLELGSSYSKLYAVACHSAAESASCEISLVTQFKNHDYCDNVLPGGEGQSDSHPHWVYCATRASGGVVRRAPKRNRAED